MRLSLISSTSYWIGLDNLLNVGLYTWSSGQSLGIFAPWRSGHDDEAESKCVAMVIDDQGQLIWDSRDCDETLPYICQYPPGGMPSSINLYHPLLPNRI